MSTASSVVLAPLKKVLGGLALLAFVVAVVLGVLDTAYNLVRSLQYIRTHLNDSDDDKFLYQWGGSDKNAHLVTIFTIKHMTPDKAVIGIPPSGRSWILFWGLLYPRQVVVVESREDFEREQPTHLLLEGDFPPYTFPNDPRATVGQRTAKGSEVVQVHPVEQRPRTLLQAWTRPVAAIAEALSPLAAGATLLLFITPGWSEGWACFLGLAFLLGVGVHTLLLFCLSLAGIPLTNTIVWTADGSLLLLCLVAAYRRRGVFRGMMPDGQHVWLTKRNVAMLTILGFLLLSHLIQNLYWPVYHFDAVVSYDYRAKAIAQQGTVAISQFSQNPGRVNFYYPFFVTMLHAHHYLLGGSHPKVYYTLLLAAFLVLFYSSLRACDCSAFQGLVFTVLLGGNVGVTMVSQDATLNFAQMVYGTLGLLFLQEYIVRQKDKALLLSGLCLGFAGWVRTDSLVILAVALVVMLLGGRLPARMRLWGVMVLAGSYGFIALPYEYFMRGVIHYDVAAYYKLSTVHLLDMHKLWIVLHDFGIYSISPWMGFVALPWLLVVLADWPWRQETRPLLLAVGVMIAGWVGLFSSIGSADWAEIMRMSAGRWYVNFIPLYLFCIAQSHLMRLTFDILEGRTSIRLRLEL